ncbi:MAG TPA: hypothetical protein EYN37_01095, partial [Dehalococcoidia bacterium]|nr:hypothetical protein [Dehalococcoidia bacterium]
MQWEVDGVPVTTNPLNLDKVIDGPSVIFGVYEPLPDHPTAAPNSWDAGSDAATTIWTVTNPTTGALLDWSLRSDASWLKAEFFASSDDPNGTGVLSPGESLSIPLLVNRDDLRSGAYSGSVFFDYSENTGISGSLEINEEMSRVLAPGGSLVVCAWGPLEDNPYPVAQINIMEPHVGAAVRTSLAAAHSLGNA